MGGDGTLVGNLPNPQVLSDRYKCNTNGLECSNSLNPEGCFDYEVRYLCKRKYIFLNVIRRKKTKPINNVMAV